MPCPIPKHILVHERAFDAFVDAFGARANGCRTIAQDPAVGVLAPLPHPDAFDAALVELREVGTVVTGGYRMQADGSRDANGAYAAPTIALMDADICFKRSLRCFDEEVFFPLIPVVRFKGSDAQIQSDMVELVRRGPFGLRMSLWTETESVLAYFARNVDNTGLLIFNDEHAQCPRHAAPWGGPGRSGGPGGESHFFWEKTSHLQAIAARRLAPAQRSAILGALGHVPASRSPTTGESETRLTIDGNVATVELCRPERHNAVTPRMKDELAQHVATLRTRLDTLSCVVIRGAGKSFCSGADLDLLDGFDVDTARRFMMEATWVFRALGRLPVPVVAAVTGFCMGGGVELALHCDLVIAASDATFALPEAQLGLITTAGSITRLSEIVGHAAARDMVLTGRRISGRQAHAMGLVARVVEPGELDGAIATACQAFSEQPRAGLAAAKQIFRELGAASHSHGWTRETEAFCDLMESRGSHAS
jgi:enoyl-CoA hydratase/carnithine racemase